MSLASVERGIFSVIIPAYNQARYVGAAVESGLGQSYPPAEIIVVDDGSTDETPALLAGYGEAIQVIRQENQGLAAARNRGIAAAQGEWLAFLDSDDRWRPDYLQQMAAVVAIAPRPVAAFAAWQYMDSSGTVMPQAVIPFGGDVQRVAAELVWRNSLLPSAAVVRREAAGQVGGFDTGLAACEDWDMWLRLQPLGRFALVRSVLMDYRTHGENMSNDPANIERERLKVNRKHTGAPDGLPQGWPEARRKAFGYTYFTTALAYFRLDDIERGVAKLNEAVACWPELAGLDEFFYELGCARQGRGVRGTGNALDLTESEALLRSLLSGRLALPAGQGYWGHACLVLARLAAAANKPTAGRRYALQALRYGRLAHKRAAARALLRSFF